MLTRRQFLKIAAAAGAAMSVAGKLSFDAPPAFAFSQSDNLKKFIQPLRMIGADIPIASPDATSQSWWQPGVTHYTIDVGQYTDQLHPDLPNPTRLWGYGQNGNFKHLGGVIAAKRGEPVQITFRNNLPPDHILPVDDTIMGVMGNQNNRTDVHLHGGYVPWVSDGGPHAWWDPDGHRGPSFVNALGAPLAQNEAEYYYPNNQSARLMWYHDHVFGLTRLNAYAGVATGYVIYDDYELELVSKSNLPGPLDPRTVYLIFQDKVFVSNDIATRDPDWLSIIPSSLPGDLWYAHQYEAERWDIGASGTPPAISCIPEFFGDTMLVNGTAYPVLEVEQRQYRFRMLNACQARFLNPRLVFARGFNFPDNTEPSRIPGPPFIQIGTEGGFLPYPAVLSLLKQPDLLLAPAERADLIVDFRLVPAGSTLLLYSDAPAPFPMGDELTDFYPGSPNPTASLPGYGPNTRTLMMVKVKQRKGAADRPIQLPVLFKPTDPFMLKQIPGKPNAVPKGVPVRYLTLNEGFDEDGRLIQRLGTDTLNPMTGDFSRGYMEDPTEVIPAGSTEVWEIINLTGDAHPIHFHLTNVQVLSRQPFDAEGYTGGAPHYTGAPIAPDLNELGWKETVRMNPGEVTRVIQKFTLPAAPFSVPLSTRPGINGHEYVWHCHILEHEEHDMMRPLVVT
jgi:FtsP/CotA-like multicopper oxidase with cupredoxin domain